MLDLLFGLKVEQFVWDPPVTGAGQGASAVPTAAVRGGEVKPYNLTPEEAAARITVWVNGGEVSKELILGKQVPDKEGEVYAKRRDFASVFTVNKAILDVFSAGINELRDRRLFSIRPEEAHYVCFQEGDKKLVMSRKPDTGWALAEPVQWRADGGVVEEILRHVAALEIRTFADGTQTNLAELGLNPPARAIQILREAPQAAPPEAGTPPEKPPANGAVRAARANCLLLGGFREGRDSVFATFEGQPVKFGDGASVFTVSAALIKPLVEGMTDPLMVRDRTVLAIRPENVKRIGRTAQGAEQAIERGEEGEWVSVVPEGQAVSKAVIDDMLAAVSNLRALRFRSGEVKDPAKLGLDRSGVTLTFGLSGKEGLQKTLILGFRAETGGIYASIQGQDVVFVLDDATVRRLTRALAVARTTGSKAEPKPAD
jgi:hypothetical protein